MELSSEEIITENIPNTSKDDIIKNLKKDLQQSQSKLKSSQESITKLECLYCGSEEEAKRLEEEKDRLKIEVKDLKEFTKSSGTSKGVEEEKVHKVCKFQ